MVLSEEQKRSPMIQKKTLMDSNSQNVANTLISPRFKSAAAMAGWDEEALLLATLIVEDTPDRDIKHKKRSLLSSKSPRTNSTRKRRAERISQSIPIAVLDLDEEEDPKKDSEKKKKEKKKDCVSDENKVGENESTKQNSSSTCSTLPCIDKIREELSCAICLDICYEPSTTPCGHSFCKKCLRSAADKCGKKCPKCRQLIGNGRSCTVNTSLWNTIQLLFPQEVEARKLIAASTLNNNNNNNNNSRQVSFQSQSQETSTYNNQRNRSIQPYASSRSLSSRRSQTTTTQEDEDAALARRLQREIERLDNNNRTTTTTSYSRNHQTSTTTSERVRTRRGVSNQDEDAAIALRLQREEFMQTFRNNSQEQSTIPSSSLARANLRAMASRAMRRY